MGVSAKIGQQGFGARLAKGIEIPTALSQVPLRVVSGEATVDQYTGNGFSQDLIQVAGVEYTASHVPLASAALALADTAYAIPFYVGKAGTVSHLLQRQYSSSGVLGKFRHGIYECRPKGCYPGALLFDGGEVSASGNQRYSLTCGLSLGVGIYFAVTVGNASMVSQAVTLLVVSDSCPPVIGTPSDLNNAGTGGSPELVIGWRHALTYGALPTTFPFSAPTRLKHRQGNFYPSFGMRWIYS